MVLLIDNYDSFSYNLYQLIGELVGSREKIRVIRNDELSLEEIEAGGFSSIVISPGPGRPEDAGICQEVVKKLSGKVPILGVCLGHQAICQAFGARVTYAARLMHGKQNKADIFGDCPIFKGLPDAIDVARYHSLSLDESTLTDDLKICAKTDDGEVMAVMHKDYPTFGLQFHPESIMTPRGREIIKNFLNIKL